MAIEQLKVREIVKRAVSEDVDISEFQREFVWDPEQVKLLAESLYRDYPIGFFLLWDSSAYQEAKTAKGSQTSLWIVDGQQRITALCLLLGQKPYWWPDTHDWNEALERYDVLVNLMPEEGDDRLEFALLNPIRRRDPRWMSVRRILSLENVESLTSLAQETAERLAAQPDEVLKVFGQIHARMQRLWQIRERDIPIIKISHEAEDVAEIFARLNQLANWDRCYSGSAITALNEDVRAITEAPSFEDALWRLEKRLSVSPEIAEDEFLARYDRSGSRFLRLMLWLLLFDRNASDWVDGTRLGYDKTGSSITAGFEPQWHHIYPRSVLRKAGRSDDDIHALANITVLNERTNVRIRRLAGKEPWRYIREYKIGSKSLKAHLIPAHFAGAVETARLKEQWAVRNYDDFLRERAQLLAKEATAFLRRLSRGREGNG